MNRLTIPSGVVIGAVFLLASYVAELGYAWAVAWLLVGGVLAWNVMNRNIETVKVFATAIVVVGLVWAYDLGAFGGR